MSNGTNSINWGWVFALFAPLLFLLAAVIWGMFQPNPSCGFMKVKRAGGQEMLSLYQDEGLMGQAKARCESSDWVCYKNIVYGAAGGGINAPMGTGEDCIIYYDPYNDGHNVPLISEEDVRLAQEDFLSMHRDMGIDQAVTAYFNAMLAHERKHQEFCLQDTPPYTIDDHQQDEIQAYQVFLQEMDNSIKNLCGQYMTYCPCKGHEKNYDSAEECDVQCPSGLKCFGVQCTLPP